MGRPWPAPGEPFFLPEDTALAVALQEQEAAEEAERCPLCGLTREVCRDPDNQFRFVAQAEQCHASAAIATAQAQQGADEVQSRALSWSAQLRH